MTQISAGGAQTIGPASGGKVTAINNLTSVSNTQVIGSNPSRVSITFHAPGSIDIYVSPTVNAQGQTLAPSLASLGGTYHIFAGADRTLTGECQGAFQAFSASSTNQPLTVSESNV
jgi:hypothetical protein